jgi:hypothetical protein
VSEGFMQKLISLHLIGFSGVKFIVDSGDPVCRMTFENSIDEDYVEDLLYTMEQ